MPVTEQIGQEELRRFVYTEGKSNKFWEIWKVGTTSYGRRWGKIGCPGSSNSWNCRTIQERNREVSDLIIQKLTKGYREVEVAATFKSAPPPMPKKKTEPKPKKKPNLLSRMVLDVLDRERG
jgi:predicted DNA-binding WGR domain protein